MNNPKEKFSEQLSALKSAQLSPDEREDLRDRLLHVMEITPVISGAAARHHKGGSNRAPLNSKKKNTMIGLIIAGIFALSGGVSFAAQSSLPGDVLYPVKIHVNENIEGALHLGAKQDAAFAQEQLERRNAEAKKLEAQNRLDAKAKATLGAEVKAHIIDFKEAKAQIESEGNKDGGVKAETEVHATLGASLKEFLDVGANANDAHDASTSSDEEIKSGIHEDNNTEVEIKDNIEIHAPVVAPISSPKVEIKGGSSLNIGI